MKVVRLNDDLFTGKLKGKEISDNKEGSRPYYCSFERNNNTVCIPFRTNATKVPDKYKVRLDKVQPDRPNSAVDLTKAIVINNKDYYNNSRKAKIEKDLNNYLKQKTPEIEKKYNVMTHDYIRDKANLMDTPFIKFSTLQYFHDDLNIDRDIYEKRLNYCVNELNSSGYSNRYNTLKEELPRDYSQVLSKHEILKDFKDLSDYTVNKNQKDINNPSLTVFKEGKEIEITAEDITDKPEKYVKEFLDFNPKNQQESNNELDL